MRKSTLFVVLLAGILGGYVYYAEIRHPKEKPAENASQPIYKFSTDDITSLRITRQGESAPVELTRGGQGWVLKSPVEAPADRTTVESLTSALGRAASTRTLPADPARLKEFGLDPPAASVEINLKNGPAQRLEVGAKDFSGSSVYARQGGAKDVLLLSDSVLTELTRPVNELRNRSLLLLESWNLTEIDFHTPKANFRLEKKGANWDVLEPRPSPADEAEATSLSTSLSGARFSDVVEEQGHDLARYGLAAPQISIHLRNEQGVEGTVLIGKKEDGKYYARDAARSLVFRVGESDLKKFLDASFESLRDKHVLRAQADDFTQLSIRNEKGTIQAARSADGKWIVSEPADRKGKELYSWRVFEPITGSRATEVLDKPSAAILAKLAKPAVEIHLTGKNSETVTVVFSAADGNSVYARSSRSPAVYRFDAYTLTQLNFPAAEVTS
jgi:hypothetical protein